jgi:hypothetical protein
MPRFTGKTIDNKPQAQWPSIYAACRKHERFTVEIRKYDEQAEISRNQMAYLHAVIIPLFSNYTGDSQQYWENKLKLECGSKWFKPEIITVCGREFVVIPSKKTLSVKDFSEWYQNIRDYGDTVGCIVPPPDPNWREEEQKILT